jgi:DNA-binding FrmR family transcriptional regulator
MNHKQSTKINFKKAKTHIEKIINMIEEDKYCIDIMQQNLAVIGLLKSAHQMLMENHLNTCFLTAMQFKNNSKQEKMIKEILQVIRYYNK